MLKAQADLDRTPSIKYKVVIIKAQWYILRRGMLPVCPESEIAEVPRQKRIRLQVQFSPTVMALITPEAARRFQGSLGLLIEEALLEKYASGNEKMMMEFRREVREVVRWLPKGSKKQVFGVK